MSQIKQPELFTMNYSNIQFAKGMNSLTNTDIEYPKEFYIETRDTLNSSIMQNEKSLEESLISKAIDNITTIILDQPSDDLDIKRGGGSSSCLSLDDSQTKSLSISNLDKSLIQSPNHPNTRSFFDENDQESKLSIALLEIKNWEYDSNTQNLNGCQIEKIYEARVNNAIQELDEEHEAVIDQNLDIIKDKTQEFPGNINTTTDLVCDTSSVFYENTSSPSNISPIQEDYMMNDKVNSCNSKRKRIFKIPIYKKSRFYEEYCNSAINSMNLDMNTSIEHDNNASFIDNQHYKSDDENQQFLFTSL